MKEAEGSRFFFLSEKPIDKALSQITQYLEKMNIRVNLKSQTLEISYADSPVFTLIYLEKNG